MKEKEKTKGEKRIKTATCIFCRIVAGKAEAYPIYEDEFSLGILDVNPFTQGHSLVLSKRHVPWWHDLTEEETKSLFSVSRIIARKLEKAFKPDFVCMYARGRRIPHTHIFLVPTFSGDLLDRFFNALEGAQEFPNAIVPVKRKKALKKTAGLLKSRNQNGKDLKNRMPWFEEPSRPPQERSQTLARRKI
jgi:histidine triad (HIT) family protein